MLFTTINFQIGFMNDSLTFRWWFLVSQFSKPYSIIPKIIIRKSEAIQTSLVKVIKKIFLIKDFEGFFKMNLVPYELNVLMNSITSCLS